MSSASMNTENEANMEHAYLHERPERDAKFFARMGWILAIVGAGSFFTWAALAPARKLLRRSQGSPSVPCLASVWSRA